MSDLRAEQQAGQRADSHDYPVLSCTHAALALHVRHSRAREGIMSSFSISGCLRRVAPALLLVAVADACGPLRRGGQPPTLLIFSNQSLDQAPVYVAASGLDFRRIGTVFGGQTDTLTVPADVATRGGTVNIVARLLARSDIPQIGPVPISPGQQYQVTLPPNGRLLSILPAGS